MFAPNAELPASLSKLRRTCRRVSKAGFSPAEEVVHLNKIRCCLGKWILAQGQGGRDFQSRGIYRGFWG